MSDSFVTLWAVACQASLSIGFPRQEYWSQLPFPSPGDLTDPGIELVSPELAGRFFTTEPILKSNKMGKFETSQETETSMVNHIVQKQQNKGSVKYKMLLLPFSCSVVSNCL